MYRLHALLLAAALGAAFAAPAAAQPTPAPPASDPPSAGLSEFVLGAFVRDATTFTALPWQQDALGLTAEQAAALRGIAAARQGTIQELYEELRMLFENVAMLDRPVDAHEAFALYYDVAQHKAEALLAFREAAEAMLAVLTPEQRATWERVLEESAREQNSPAMGYEGPDSPATNAP
jgi:Spy/CpxP family protein refolding chaperone